MKRIATAAVATVTCVVAGSSVALAAWLASGTGSGGAKAASLGTPTTGPASVSATSVSFTVSGGGTSPAPSGYRVDRTVPAPTVTDVCPTADNAGDTCTDSTPVAGPGTYLVYATLGSWQSATPAVVNVTVPASGVVAAPSTPDLAATSDSGVSSTDDVTNDTTPTFTGTAPSGATVKLLDGSTQVGSVALGSGVTSWSITTSALSAGSHAVKATATVGAITSAPSAALTVTVDTTGPSADSVSSADVAGTAGKLETGDTLTLGFDESVDGTSIVNGWTGNSLNVVVRAVHGSGGTNDQLQVFNTNNTAQIAIGTVDLGSNGFFNANVTYGASGTKSTMTMSNGAVTITLGTVSNTASVLTRSASNQRSKLTWTPPATVKDPAGNTGSTTPFVGANATQF